MRAISQALLNQLASKAHRPAYFVTFNIGGGTIRLTTWNTPLALANSLFTPRGMDISSIGYGSSSIANGCSLSVDDIDRTLYASLGQIGPGDWETSITLGVLDKNGVLLSGATSVIFRGFITEWTFSAGKMNIRLRSPFAKWARKTTRLFSTSCSVKVFKSSQCGYSGPEERCSRTFEQCELYNNTVNFQGFRWLEDLASRRIDLTGESPPPAEPPIHTTSSYNIEGI